MSAVPADLVEKFCKHCEEVLPTSAFSRTRSTPDGFTVVCKPCRTPIVITDPDVSPDVLSFRGFDFVLPQEMKDRIRAGSNLRVTVALHVDHAQAQPGKEPRWSSRWLEVISVDG